jgi:hypothetical protein
MSAIDADIDATGTLLDGDAPEVLAGESAGLDLLVVALGATGRCAPYYWAAFRARWSVRPSRRWW